MLSVVIPAYNEEPMILKAYKTISNILQKNNILYELIFVNDGSTDKTWDEIKKIANENVIGLQFSRNFGKEAAILAGLSNATGECVAVIDCDLQHPPEILVDMYHLWEEGYEVIEGVKKSRGKENVLHTASANIFYKVMSKAVKIDMSRASDFRLLDRKVVDVLISMPEQHAFFRALSSWVGFKSTTIEFDVQERTEGESKWSVMSLIKYAISNIIGFSTMPLQLITIAGCITFIIGIIFGIQSLIRYFLGCSLEGFTTVILLLLIIGSLIMISLGIIGIYLSKIYEEVKMRPRYIISKYSVAPEPPNPL